MKKRKKLLRLFFAVALFCTFIMSMNAVSAKADETEDADVFSIEESYTRRLFTDFYDAGDFSWSRSSNESVQISVDKDASGNGLMISGDSGVMNLTKFTIQRKFQFDGNKVSRLVLDALAGKGLDVKVDCYLDDETDPIASFSLYTQGRSDLWTRQHLLTADLRGKNITGIHTVSFILTCKDTGSMSVLLRSIEFVEDSVPTLYMNIDESIQTIQSMQSSGDASVECSGEMNIVTDDFSSVYDLTYLKGCGGSNLWKKADKKQYAIKLEDEASLLGMDASSYWTLASNRPDASRLKNKIAYLLGEETGMDLTTSYIPVELVLNGEYAGMYYLTENLADADEDSIETEKQNVENAISGDDFKDENGVSYSEYMDVNSAVEYFWMQQLFNYNKAFSSEDSCLYKKDGKIFWGPLGDFCSASWDENDMEGFNTSKNAWIHRLRHDPSFVKALTDQWPEIYEKVMAYCADGGQIDQYYNGIKAALRYDFETWGLEQAASGDDEEDEDEFLDLMSVEDSSTDQKTIEDAKDEVRSYLKKRAEWINDNLSELQLADCKITFKADGKICDTKTVTAGTKLTDIPDAPDKSGYYFKGWRYYSEDLKAYDYVDDETTFDKDTIVEAYYIATKSLVSPKNLYISSDEIWIETYKNYYFYASVYPVNAYDTNITFTSSDEENFMFVEDENSLSATAEGEYTLTVQCGSLKRVCKIHVTADDEQQMASISLKNSSLSLKKGEWKQIELNYSPAIHIFSNYQYYSSNSSVASVDNCGVVMAKKAGTATIIIRDVDHDQILKCKITVNDPSGTNESDAKNSVKKGSTFTQNRLKYKVTKKSKTGGNVTVAGVLKKNIKKISVPSTVKYKGETYKVTGISAKAFYNCKKLKKITLGKNLKSIGNKAFKNIHKKAVFKVPSSKKKAYKKLLTKKKGFRKTMRVK